MIRVLPISLAHRPRYAYLRRRSCFSAFTRSPSETSQDSFKVACPVCAGTGLLPPTCRCPKCDASGLVSSDRRPPSPPPSFGWSHPVCIIGAGISGLALSCSLSHRGIPHLIFDRDPSPTHRRQGFSLTLQQSRVTSELGLDLAPYSLSSSRHVVLDADGELVASWGRGLHGAGEAKAKAKRGRRNFHISRSSLRSNLLSSNNSTPVNWGKEVLDFHQTSEDEMTVEFTDRSTVETNLLVGCDGVHSAIRSKIYPPRDDPYPITAANVTVALGIFPPASLPVSNPLADLLDFQTVVQIADGRRSRIYLQPYDSGRYMWQFSYLDEPWGREGGVRRSPDEILSDLTGLSRGWHDSALLPVFESTPRELMSAYSIVDRPLPANFRPANGGHPLVTFIGDAAHPMTPFKGWGANAALADGLELGRIIAWNGDNRTLGHDALTEFEEIMLKRVQVKVEKSREAAVKLHSESVLKRTNVARGSV